MAVASLPLTMDDANKHLARQLSLRARRRSAGLSIDEAGRRAGVERSRISRGERGYGALHPEEIDRLETVIAAALSRRNAGSVW